ncbi:hypothetical protein MRX96_049801 [Rhipicephalus microplus]
MYHSFLPQEVLSKCEDFIGHTKERSPGIFIQPYDDWWPSKGVIRFENFSASYHPGIGDDTLKGICFVAEAGKKLAVVGRTGAGKSSLVLALLRMIQRTSGAITIDGIDINSVPLKRLRTAISVIPQCWDSDNWWHSLVPFCEPQGFWCWTKPPPRWTPDTERRVQASLRESFSHCTIITIAHRIDTILDYDRVVVMGDGRVLETGGVQDLLSNPCSLFRDIVISAGIDGPFREDATRRRIRFRDLGHGLAMQATKTDV